MSTEETPQVSENGREVYIRGLSPDVTEDELTAAFSTYGTLEKVRVKSRPKGSFAFLLYEDASSADDAIAAMNDQPFNGGENLEVALAREPRKRERTTRALGNESKVQLFCANLPWSMTDDDLNEIFAGKGDMEECVVVKKPDGRSRGFGFAKFVSEADAAAAIASLDGYVMNAGTDNERPLRLQYARELVESDNADPKAASSSSSAPARRKREPRAARPAPGTVKNQIFCSNLPSEFRASHLKSMFGADYTVVGQPFISRKKGNRRRFGFIVLGSEDEVNAAVNDMNEAEFTSEGTDEDPWVLKVEVARPRAPRAATKSAPTPRVDDTPRRIFCKGFPGSFTREDLQELFQDFGDVQSVKLRKKGKKGGPFAHLVFGTEAEADAAVAQRSNQELDIDEVDEEGNKFVLVVEKSRPRAPRNRRARAPVDNTDTAAAAPATAATSADATVDTE